MGIIADIKKEIELLHTKIEKIQNGCCHPEEAQTATAGGEEAEDPLGSSTYYIEITCGLCEHIWREDR